MDLDFTPQQEAFRAEVRAWLRDHVPQRPLASYDTGEGFEQHRAWEAKLAAGGYSSVIWPTELGGRGSDLIEWLIFEEEYYRAGGPQRVTQNGIFLLAPTVFEFGTPEQQAHILPRMAAGDDLWCQGWSEPNAGSDLASLSSRATRDDARGGWVLNGQKTWTTRGAFCTHLFGLFRTDPDQQRHRGLTYFMVPLDAEGITVRGFTRLDGDEGFAEVFFEDAFVSDEWVLGEVDAGWSVAMSTTSSERGLTLRSPGRFMATAERLVARAREHEDLDPVLADRVTTAWMAAEAYQLYTLADVTDVTEGRPPGARSSLNKLWWSELDVELHRVGLELAGAEAELDEGSPGAVDDGRWMKGWQFALSGPIYAGTNEIQRNIVAERVLGLPRK